MGVCVWNGELLLLTTLEDFIKSSFLNPILLKFLTQIEFEIDINDRSSKNRIKSRVNNF